MVYSRMDKLNAELENMNLNQPQLNRDPEPDHPEQGPVSNEFGNEPEQGPVAVPNEPDQEPEQIQVPNEPGFYFVLLNMSNGTEKFRSAIRTLMTKDIRNNGAGAVDPRPWDQPHAYQFWKVPTSCTLDSIIDQVEALGRKIQLPDQLVGRTRVLISVIRNNVYTYHECVCNP